LPWQKQLQTHYKLGEVTHICPGCNVQNYMPSLHHTVAGGSWEQPTAQHTLESCLHTGTLLCTQISNPFVTCGVCGFLEKAAGQTACSAPLGQRASRAAEVRGGGQGLPPVPRPIQGTKGKAWGCVAAFAGNLWPLFPPLPQVKSQHMIISVLVLQKTKQLPNSYPKPIQS